MAPKMRFKWRMKNGENSHPVGDAGALGQELELLWKERGPSGKAYDLYLSRISRSPVVHSHLTGKYFLLPWSRIIKLAEDAGLDAWS